MTSLFRILAVVAVILLPVRTPAWALDIDISQVTLDNGLQLVVIPDHRAPVVTHMIWYRVGAADEPQGKAGIAHFLEHLMFKGTTRFPQGEFSRLVRANGGDENAFTSQDYTAYFQRIARDRLAMVMEMEADRMQNLVLTDANVLPERAVVEEERRERIENDPSSLLSEQIDAALYTAHPYRKPVIGWMPEVSKLTRQDALDFYQVHYQPSNAIVIVAGDVTADEVEALTRKYYGPLQNHRTLLPRERTPEPAPIAERRIIMRDDKVSTPIWQRKYLAPAAQHLPQREELAMSLLANIIGSGSQSRFYQRLSIERKLTAYAGAWYSGDALDVGSFLIYAAPNPGVEIEAVEAAIDEILTDIRDKGVTQQELDRARDRSIADAVYLLDSQDALVRLFGTALTTGQTVPDVMNWEKDIAAVTPDDLRAAARSVLDLRASVTGVLLPAGTR